MNSPLKSAFRNKLDTSSKNDFFSCISSIASSKKAVNFEIEEETQQYNLQDEIRSVLKQVKVELDNIVSHPSSKGPSFCFSPMRFSPEDKNSADKYLDSAIENKPQNKRNEDPSINQFVRNYDIEKIREQRVLQSFTFGRKLRYTENCDERINTAIENKMNNNCCKRASRLKSGNKNKDCSPTKQLDPTIFKSNDMDKRTNDFYKAFASEMLMKDMSKDKKQGLRKKKRKDKLSYYKNIKKRSSEVNMSFDWQSTREISEVIPIKEEKRIIVDKIAEILTSTEKPQTKEFHTFFNRRVSCDDKIGKRRVSTAASRNIHFSTKLCIPSFYKQKRVSITREKNDTCSLEVNPRYNKNSKSKWSSKCCYAKDEDSPKDSEYSTKSTINKDRSIDRGQQGFRHSDKQCFLKLHLNKCTPDKI